MSESRRYILDQDERAARRLHLQDSIFGEMSERLLDELGIRPDDRVVEIGCGPGSLSRRIMQRLDAGGVLIGVDSSETLLAVNAAANVGGPARFVPRRADISELGEWLDDADVLVGRAVVHHLPMAEYVLGRMRPRLRPGARIGFLEPDFRTPLLRLAMLASAGRPELAPLLTWATAINDLYQVNRLSSCVGATLAASLSMAGFFHVRSEWAELRTDATMIENMTMFTEEVRDRLVALGLTSADALDQQQRLLMGLSTDSLPAVWGMFRVTAEA